jgi:predicted nucleic acid-binding protein
MTAVLVDSSVLLDVVNHDEKWSPWSLKALAAAASTSVLFINPIIYAEVSVRYALPSDLDRVLPESRIRREALSFNAAFLAGKAMGAYRRRGGTQSTVLADFLIGAHAQSSGYRLLTRDTKRFRQSFPDVVLIAPD